MMKELLAIEQELKEIQEEGNKRIREYQAEINVAMENEEAANRAVIQAKQGNDPKAYSKAIEEKRMASNIVQYYEGKIEQIKNDPFITECEYNNYTNRIKEEMDAINNKGKAKVSKLFEELEAIKEEVSPALAKTNELLRELQNNIYKLTYEKQMKDAREKGIPINVDRLHNEYKDYSLTRGINHILQSNMAKTIKEGGSK